MDTWLASRLRVIRWRLTIAGLFALVAVVLWAVENVPVIWVYGTLGMLVLYFVGAVVHAWRTVGDTKIMKDDWHDSV